MKIRQAFLSLLIWTCPALLMASDAGFVLEVHGNWILDSAPTKMLVTGQALPASSKIRPKGLRENPRIVVVLLDGKTILRDCAVKEQCNEPIALPEFLGSESSAWSRLVSAVGAVFEREPARYQPMIARSALSPADSVLELRGGKVDLAPLLQSLRPSTYDLAFHSLQTPQDIVRFRCAWKPATHAVVTTDKLRNGIYNVTLNGAGGKGEAWCLVSSGGNYSKYRSEFQQAKEMTDSWNLSNDRAAIKSFLRACLQHLYQSSQ